MIRFIKHFIVRRLKKWATASVNKVDDFIAATIQYFHGLYEAITFFSQHIGSRYTAIIIVSQLLTICYKE